jgi:hypothetical protein
MTIYRGSDCICYRTWDVCESCRIRTNDVVGVFAWDEPAGAVTPRGWLHGATLRERTSRGWYLDYGPENRHAPRSILACAVASGLTRWCATVEEARAWVESVAVHPVGKDLPTILA